MASIWRVNNSTLLGGEICAQWQPGHAYSLGARCVCRIAYGTTARRAYVYECTTAGTSHGSTEPTWPTSGTVNDNDVVWTCRNPNDGNWDNASCILYYVLNHAAVGAGDKVYIDDGHNEQTLMGSYAAYTIYSVSPLIICCVDKASDALSTGAIVCDSSDYGYIQFNGKIYSYGVTYKVSGTNGYFTTTSGANGSGIILEGNNTTVLETESSGSYLSTGSGSWITIKNGNIDVGNPGFKIRALGGQFNWIGGALIGQVTNLMDFTYNNGYRYARFKDVDLSAFGDNYLFNGGTYDYFFYDVIFERCKMPPSFKYLSGTPASLGRGSIQLHHCSSNYDFYKWESSGVSEDETTIVRTDGASNGATPFSAKMVSSSLAVDNIFSMELIPIHAWTDSTSEKTFSIEIVHDSVTALQDDEIWMELEYPANNTDGLGAIASSRCAPLGTPADIPDSSEAWTTTGLTNPNTRKLSVTCTPGRAGPITARVHLAKPSTTVYVDPMITES